MVVLVVSDGLEERGMNRMERHPETQEECQWGRRQFRNRMGRITLSNFEAGKKEP